jgi:hypothetical protein
MEGRKKGSGIRSCRSGTGFKSRDCFHQKSIQPRALNKTLNSNTLGLLRWWVGYSLTERGDKDRKKPGCDIELWFHRAEWDLKSPDRTGWVVYIFDLPVDVEPRKKELHTSVLNSLCLRWRKEKKVDLI